MSRVKIFSIVVAASVFLTPLATHAVATKEKKSTVDAKLKRLIKDQKELHNTIVKLKKTSPLPKKIKTRLQANLNQACVLGYEKESEVKNKKIKPKIYKRVKNFCRCVSSNHKVIEASVDSIKKFPGFKKQGREANAYMLKKSLPVINDCDKRYPVATTKEREEALKQYYVTSKIYQGLIIVSSVKLAVVRKFQQSKSFPNNNREAGIRKKISSEVVDSVEISQGGKITVNYKPDIFKEVKSGHVLVIQPLKPSKELAILHWHCGADGTTIDKKFLPRSCLDEK